MDELKNKKTQQNTELSSPNNESCTTNAQTNQSDPISTTKIDIINKN